MQELLNIIKNGKEFSINDDLFPLQELILDFLLELEDNVEANKVLKNEYIWSAMALLLQKKVMNLRYFGIIPEPENQ